MRTRSFIATILVIGIATGVVIADFRRTETPVTHAASAAAQTFNQLLVSFIDTDEFVEYWNDFTRNTCQRDEIFRLHDSMDATRASLRAALYGTALSAGNSAVTGSETTVADPQTYIDLYREQTVELYYLRRFVQSHEVPLIGAPTSGHAVAKDKDALQTEMYGRFVEDKGWYSDADFEELFTQLTDDYSDKKEEFLDCGGWGNLGSIDPEFQEIKERWDHLVATIEALKNLKKSFVETFPPKSTDPSNKNADKGSVGSFFRQHFGFKLNGTCPKKALSAIVSDLKGTAYSAAQSGQTDCESVGQSDSSSDTSTSSGGASYSQTAILASTYDEVYQLTYRKVVLEAKYQTLYATGSDAAVTDLLQLLQYAEGGDSLDTHIRNSIPEFNAWEKCAAVVNNKFCS